MNPDNQFGNKFYQPGHGVDYMAGGMNQNQFLQEQMHHQGMMPSLMNNAY